LHYNLPPPEDCNVRTTWKARLSWLGKTVPSGIEVKGKKLRSILKAMLKMKTSNSAAHTIALFC